MNLVTTIVMSFVVAPAPEADPTKETLEALRGEWTAVQFIKDGSNRLKKDGQVTLRFEGEKVKLRDGEFTDDSTFTLDPKADPKAINLKVMEGGKEVVKSGIYKLEKDRLTLCIALEGGARPKEFKSEEDGKTVLLVLERVKK